MTERVYVAEVIGTGVVDITEDISDPFRSAVNPHLGPDSYDDIDMRRDNTSALGRMLSLVFNPTDAEHAAMVADPLITYLPFEDSAGDPLPRTALLSQVNTVKLTAIKTGLETHHVPTDGIVLTMTIAQGLKIAVRRFLLRQILKTDDFNENFDTLTIGDIPVAKRLRIAQRLQPLGFDTSVLALSMTIREGIKLLLAQKVTWLENHLYN